MARAVCHFLTVSLAVFFHNLDTLTDLIYIFTTPMYNQTILTIMIASFLAPIVIITFTVCREEGCNMASLKTAVLRYTELEVFVD